MQTRMCPLFALVALCGGTAAASGQIVVNGDFERQDLSGWTVMNTANGAGAPGSVTLFDMDGAGPLPQSYAATFSVGQAVFSSGVQEGIELTQSVTLQASTQYTIDLDWAAQRQVNVGNAAGGLFTVLIGGAVVATADAGSTTAMELHSGHISAAFTVPASGPVDLTIRITRPYQPGGALFQYVDNVAISGGGTGGCYANCDQSTVAPILNVGDFTCFLQRFAAGESYANCDNSTVAPVLNVGDFTCFLQRFAAGCP
jgi:hypothetical protein